MPQLKYIGVCGFSGQLYNLGRYPGLKEGDSKIAGELYQSLDPSVLKALDTYEAVDNEDSTKPGFTRRQIMLLDPKLKAWVYYYDGDVKDAEQLEGNPWV